MRAHAGRRCDRDGADRGSRRGGAQGLRRVRGRDRGRRRPRVATRPRSRRDRRDGPGSVGHRRARPAASEGSDHPLLGTGSVHASVIEGGQEYSSYPAACRLQGERRTMPGETRRGGARRARGLVAGTGATVSLPFHREPFETLGRRGGRAVAAHRHLGHEGGRRGRLLGRLRASRGRGDPDRGLRALRRRASTATDEWVDLASLERCHDAYLAVARELCA